MIVCDEMLLDVIRCYYIAIIALCVASMYLLPPLWLGSSFAKPQSAQQNLDEIATSSCE